MLTFPTTAPPPGLAPVVPALLHYETLDNLGVGVLVVQKRGNHWDKPKWRSVGNDMFGWLVAGISDRINNDNG